MIDSLLSKIERTPFAFNKPTPYGLVSAPSAPQWPADELGGITTRQQ